MFGCLVSMIIQLLADHKYLISTLTDWYRSQWEPYYGIGGPGNARADLESRCNHDKLPIGLVAIQEDGVRGTVALDLDSTTNLTPSVVGLIVGDKFRRQGIAAVLVKSAEDLARELGYSELYMSTTILGDFLERSGWRELQEVTFLNNEQGSIYMRDL